MTAYIQFGDAEAREVLRNYHQRKNSYAYAVIISAMIGVLMLVVSANAQDLASEVLLAWVVCAALAYGFAYKEVKGLKRKYTKFVRDGRIIFVNPTIMGFAEMANGLIMDEAARKQRWLTTRVKELKQFHVHPNVTEADLAAAINRVMEELNFQPLPGRAPLTEDPPTVEH